MLQRAPLQIGPGSIELPRSPSPLVRANALLFVRFERPDLAKAEAYLADFGLVRVSKSERELFLRGTGSNPYIYRATLGPKARFAGLGLAVPSLADLQRLANAFGKPIEPADGPGGGSVVRLRDAEGILVEALFGFTPSAPLPLRDPIPHNAPNQTVRVNDTQRPKLEPPQVVKLGHMVLETPDFDVSVRWYMDTFGFVPSDVMCLSDGTPVGAFMRLDRGHEPTDHHTLFVAAGLESKVDHVAFEVVDLDAVEMGQQVMMAGRYRHAWGVGRHVLGSQIFDYWRDPWGQKHEHYADGDLFDVAQPAGYHVMDRAGLYQWGPDLPDDFLDARITPARLLRLIRRSLKDRAYLKRMMSLKASLGQPVRSWRS
ncbi:MAG: VOC family protein [Hyphomicrobiales bacterium]|nr:VOC family protein [Hyphomicrobiales bacterium]